MPGPAIWIGSENIDEKLDAMASKRCNHLNGAKLRKPTQFDRVALGNAGGELIDGDSDGVIAANLQARLKANAERAKVTVRSIQMLPPRALRSVTLVGARIAVSGSLEAVHSLARELETERLRGCCSAL